jgi:hypothetical protein
VWYLKLGGLLEEADRSPLRKRKAVEALFSATNFAEKHPPLNPSEYDFDSFDLEGTRQAIQSALDSKGSLPYASKKFVTPFLDMNEMNEDANVMSRMGRTAKDMKKGTAISQTHLPGGQFWEEGLNISRKDNPRNTACANCGRPHNLKACARCSQRYYCGRDCQKVLWIRDRRDQNADYSSCLKFRRTGNKSTGSCADRKGRTSSIMDRLAFNRIYTVAKLILQLRHVSYVVRVKWCENHLPRTFGHLLAYLIVISVDCRETSWVD